MATAEYANTSQTFMFWSILEHTDIISVGFKSSDANSSLFIKKEGFCMSMINYYLLQMLFWKTLSSKVYNKNSTPSSGLEIGRKEDTTVLVSQFTYSRKYMNFLACKTATLYSHIW